MQTTTRATPGAKTALIRPESLPRGPFKLASETWALYVRQLRRLARQPVVIAFSLIQPMIFLLLFGQMFSRLTQFPGAAAQFGHVSYQQFFIPTVILQSILFGAGQSGVGMIVDIDSGFLDKLLTTPINRFAILLGRVLGDLTRMLIQAIIVLVVGFIVGQIHTPRLEFAYGLPGLLGGLAIAILFGLMLAGWNVFIGLKTRNTEAAFLLSNFLIFPLLFTSSANIPVTLLPDWMQTVAGFNPVTYTIDAVRALFNGAASLPDGDLGSALAKALLILGVLAAITLTLATRAFRRAVG